jgi:N-acetylneuraminate synthase
MIISTGMADKGEIEEALDTARKYGSGEVVLLHCVSGYPAPASEYNLKTISDIQSRFSVLAGLSDHTIDNATAVTSIALGACVIEKHVTLDRHGGGPDDSFSLEPDDLKELCTDCKTAWSALGKVNYERTEVEKGSAKFRRSLYVVADMKEGDQFSEKNVRSIRPGFGLHPRYYEEVLNKKAKSNIKAGTPLSFQMIDA